MISELKRENGTKKTEDGEVWAGGEKLKVQQRKR